MAIKVENKATIKLPKKSEETIQSVFDVVPKEHTRNLNKVVLVDRVAPDPRIQLPNANVSDLPGLYHPRQGNIQPWCEIALGALLAASDGFFKRLAARLNFKANLALRRKLDGVVQQVEHDLPQSRAVAPHPGAGFGQYRVPT